MSEGVSVKVGLSRNMPHAVVGTWPTRRWSAQRMKWRLRSGLCHPGERRRRWQEITGHMCGTTCGLAAFKHPDSSLLTHRPTCTQPCKHTNFNSAGYSGRRNSPLVLSSKLWAAVPNQPRVTSHVLVCLDGFRINPGLKEVQIFVAARSFWVIAPDLKGKTESAAATRPPIQTYPAVDDGHVKRVGVQPALHSFADGADLVQRWSVHVWPTRIQSLKARVVAAARSQQATAQ